MIKIIYKYNISDCKETRFFLCNQEKYMLKNNIFCDVVHI